MWLTRFDEAAKSGLRETSYLLYLCVCVPMRLSALLALPFREIRFASLRSFRFEAERRCPSGNLYLACGRRYRDTSRP